MHTLQKGNLNFHTQIQFFVVVVVVVRLLRKSSSSLCLSLSLLRLVGAFIEEVPNDFCGEEDVEKDLSREIAGLALRECDCEFF